MEQKDLVSELSTFDFDFKDGAELKINGKDGHLRWRYGFS